MARASEIAYAALRDDVLDGVLAPGASLAEVELSARLGISRTPVREALARLVADGLARPLGGRGLVVTELDADDVVELFELRAALEQQAASLAARRGNPRVFSALLDRFAAVDPLIDTDDPARHDYYALVAHLDAAIDVAVANPYLVSALDGVRTHLQRIRRLSHDDPARLRDAAAEHRVILEAILAGDAQLAADATRVHLHRSLHSILTNLRGQPE